MAKKEVKKEALVPTKSCQEIRREAYLKSQKKKLN